ncbi:MAG: DUF4476 domain-containing protein [Microscillaceae bacterium]|nr:DUF4476 domain-containing protein [Microscillaceae bacterium]
MQIITSAFLILALGQAIRAQTSLEVFCANPGNAFLLYVNGKQINENAQVNVLATDLSGKIKYRVVLDNPPQLTLEEEIKSRVGMADPANDKIVISEKITIEVQANKKGQYALKTVSRVYTHEASLPIETEAPNPLPGVVIILPSQKTDTPEAMSQANFLRAKQSIEAQAFPDDKLATALGIVKNSWVNSNQVAAFVRMMASGDQLDLAKGAYEKTIDKGNYFQVVDALSFPTDKSELREFINQQ